MTPTALVIGEALVDLVDDATGSPRALPGGSCANVAVALARLGRPTTLVTELGNDALGCLLRDHLTASGVELVVDEHAPTSTALARIGADGAATYAFTIDWALHAPVLPAEPAVVHVGSIGAVLEPGASTVRETVERVRGAAGISYDVNARPALLGDPAQARAAVERMVRLGDLVKASDEDAGYLYPGEDLAAVADRWRSQGATAVVFTLGSEGAVAHTADGSVAVRARRVTVVDTIGAGDTFSAGLIDALWDTLTAGRLPALPLDAWAAALEHAAGLASVTVTRSGANPPWRHELARG